MKKIKKILPLLLGVMVLMFGTLTVSAAEYTVTDTTAVQQFTDYIDKQDLKDYSYKVLYYVDYSSSNRTYYYLVSDKPCSHRDGVNRAFYSVNEDTSWYLLSCSVSSGTVARDRGGTASSADSALFLVGGTGHRVVASNYDLLLRNSEGLTDTIDCEKDTTGFFPIPPVARVAEALPEVVQNQTGIILTIAVACLALLVILSVLPKKLPRFLNR